MTKLAKSCGLLVVGAALIGALAGQAQAQYTEREVVALTRPSNESKVSFEQMGTVVAIPVKEGQEVKAGDTLIQLDDELERKELAKLEIEAASELAIEAEEKALANTRVTLKRKQELHARHAATDAELEEAQLAVDIAEIKLRRAREELEITRVKRDAQKEAVRRKKLTSMIDGVVANIDVSLGEVVDPREPACTVVQNDPLWVDVHLPSAQAARLAEINTLQVRYPQSEQRYQAKVIFMSPVVDARSDRRLVRLELPNPQKIPSGLQMIVELPEQVLTAGVDGANQADASR